MRWEILATLTATAVMGMTAVPASAEPIEIGHIPECTELVPAAVTVVPDGDVGLGVHVLLDGVSSADGQAIMGQINQSYNPLGMPVSLSFASVNLDGTDADSLIQQSKEAVGGVPPGGADVVYTLTSKDIELGGNTAVAGLADCIGGVAFPERAFGVGEVIDPDQTAVGPVVVAGNLSAKVAAHEVGHLMGGHHHYANCAEGLLSELGAELSPCTLMFNAVNTTSFNFSTLNSLVVRGHGEAYAD